MDENANLADAAISRQARLLNRWLTLLIVAVGVLLVLEFSGAAGLAGPGDGPEKLQRLGWQLVYAAPAILYLCALWSIRTGLSAIGKGDLFAPAVGHALTRVGALLVAGAATAVFVLPFVHRYADDGYPRLIEFDVTNIVLGGLGVALILLARLFANAEAVRRELSEMF